MLGDGTDILGGVSVFDGGYCAWPELAGRVEQGAAQVLQEAQAVAGHGQAAPASGGPVQDGPDQGEAGGLAGEPADHLGAAAGLAEGRLDEVGVPDPVMVLSGEPQLGGEPFMIGEQALHRRRVRRRVPFCHRGDAVIDELRQPGPGPGLELFDVEQGPEGVFDLRLIPAGTLARIFLAR